MNLLTINIFTFINVLFPLFWLNSDHYWSHFKFRNNFVNINLFVYSYRTNHLSQIKNFLITIFPLISAVSTYLISRPYGVALIAGWHLKEEDAYFKAKGIIHMKFKNFVIFSFQTTINNCHTTDSLRYSRTLFDMQFNLVTFRLWSNF